MVLLAAGASTRMGRPKQLLEYRGTALARHAAEEALAACGPVFVVLGCRALEVDAALEGLPVRALVNTEWQRGMGASIRVGAAAAEAADLDGVIMALADQPHVTAAHYRRLVSEFRATGRPVVASLYAGVLGAPALFARELFRDLVALPPERGCQSIIARQPEPVPVPCEAAQFDLDTPDDYARLLASPDQGVPGAEESRR